MTSNSCMAAGTDIALVGPTGAAEILRERVAKRKVPALLAAGLLGTRYYYSDAVLVVRDAVESAAARPEVDVEHLHTQVDSVFVSRQICRTPVPDDPTRDWMGVDLFAPTSEQTAATDSWYYLSQQTRTAMTGRIDRDGFVPMISTVAGLAALCMEITSVPSDEGPVKFGTRPAGEWADAVTGRWLPTKPGPIWIWL